MKTIKTTPNPNLSIRNRSNINYTARTIAADANRGSATTNRLITVLSDLRYSANIRNLSQISRSVVKTYIEQLQDKLYSDSLSPKTVVNYISAVNIITNYIGKNDLAVSPKDLGISKGSSIATTDRSVSSAVHEAVLSYIQDKFSSTADPRYQALQHSVKLQHSFGLRFRESVEIKNKTIQDAIEARTLHLSRQDGTKNSRIRDIPIRFEAQIKALKEAKSFMKENGYHSLIDPNQTEKSNSGWSYRVINDFKTSSSASQNFHYHGERHAYAHSRYSELWEQKANVALKPPVEIEGNWHEYAAAETGLSREKVKEIDREVRHEVSRELGHERENITRTYLG